LTRNDGEAVIGWA